MLLDFYICLLLVFLVQTSTMIDGQKLFGLVIYMCSNISSSVKQLAFCLITVIMK